jgi:AcrR family transcriptional regulator
MPILDLWPDRGASTKARSCARRGTGSGRPATRARRSTTSPPRPASARAACTAPSATSTPCSCASSATAIDGARRKLEGPDSEAFQRLRDYVLGDADTVIADEIHRGCLIAKAAAECAEHDQEIATRARQAFRELNGLLTACVAAAQRAGDIAGGHDPARLAGLLLATMRGIEALGKGGCDQAGLRGIAETALAVLPKP